MKRILLSAMMALSLSACTVVPKPLTTGSLSSFAGDKLARVTADQEPISGEITLYQAMARALLYNLDFHVELYNEALASKQLDTARLDTLPELVASAGYVGRNNNAGNASSSEFPDRTKFQEDVTLSWNILDLGLSKIRAEQAADEVLVAREKRRKIINRVIEDVRTAYWRAVSADRLVVGLRKLEGRAQKALKNSASLQRDGQTSPLTALTYQRELVEIQQRIQRLQKDLSLAKIQLAALMNIKPGQHFTLAQPARRAESTDLNMTGDEMVYAALENRPEIRDIQYKLRINEKETKKALLELLPSANLFASANWDSDSYLYNTNWVGWGAKATWNLLNVFKYPAKKRLVKAKDETLDARALAVTMAIMTQVHVSRVRYGHSKKLYRTAAKHFSIQNDIVKQIRSSFAEGQASEQTLIREEMNTLASQVAADIAYADLQNAYANIYASMGIDPYREDLNSETSVDGLAAALRDIWIERGDNSGTARARRAVKDHVVTGSVRKPVNKKKVDPIVAETHGWAELKQNTSASTDPFVLENERLTNEANDKRYEPEIVRLDDGSKGTFWSRFSKALKRNGSMRVDLDQ
ncbi:MAG: TolC family protein [Rhizobiaceae bacterium]|nr:TolC family protein [Hyphomicrobiales bacterium]NRB32046.1 TolC family protein [Rhizobiaceae bacterium]